MVEGIIVTHGNLAQELLSTAKGIYGDFPNCRAISNVGKSTATLYDDIVASLDDDTPCILFVDFVGGSCSHACLRLVTQRSQAVLISGVNLPMLLAFLNKRDDLAFSELPAAIVGRGQAAIKIVDPENL
jgi:PTS system mannose-specific IIA component